MCKSLSFFSSFIIFISLSLAQDISISNHDFSQETKSWSISSRAGDVCIADNDTNGKMAIITGTADEKNFTIIYQQFSIATGTYPYLKVTAFVKADTSDAQMMITVGNKWGAKEAPKKYYRMPHSGNNTWTQLECAFQAGKEPVFLNFGIYGKKGNMYVQKITLREMTKNEFFINSVSETENASTALSQPKRLAKGLERFLFQASQNLDKLSLPGLTMDVLKNAVSIGSKHYSTLTNTVEKDISKATIEEIDNFLSEQEKITILHEKYIINPSKLTVSRIAGANPKCILQLMNYSSPISTWVRLTVRKPGIQQKSPVILSQLSGSDEKEKFGLNEGSLVLVPVGEPVYVQMEFMPEAFGTYDISIYPLDHFSSQVTRTIQISVDRGCTSGTIIPAASSEALQADSHAPHERLDIQKTSKDCQ